MSAWLVTSLARLRDARAVALGLVLLVFVTAGVAAAVPRLLARAADGVLRDEVGAAGVDVRNLQLVQEGRLPTDPSDPMTPIAETANALDEQVPPVVRSLVGSRSWAVDSPRWSIAGGLLNDRTVRFRVQQGAEAHLRLLSGTLPSAEVTDTVETDPQSTLSRTTSALQVALSADSARALHVTVGDTLGLSLDPTDELSQNGPAQAQITVSGIFGVVDPAAAYWFGDSSLEIPVIRNVSPLVSFQDVTVLVAPGAYGHLVADKVNGNYRFRYTWRDALDLGRLSDARVDDTIAALRRMETIFPATAATSGSVGPAAPAALRSGLLRLLQGYQADRAAAIAVIAVVGLGPGAVALATLALAVLHAARRRRVSLAVAASRGASSGQLVGSVVLEGSILAVPAALAGAATAALVVPGGPDAPSLAAAGAVAAAVVALLGAATRPGTLRARPRDERQDIVQRIGARRIAGEVFVVAISILAVVALRQRGLAPVASGDLVPAASGVDPLLVAAPALAGLATGLVALRLLPVPVGLLGAIAARGRGLLPMLALRRAARGGGAALLLVLLAATALGVFSAVVLAHLDGAASAVAWHEAGADFRIWNPNGVVPDELGAATLPGARAVASAYAAPSVDARARPFTLLALDAVAYETVTRGTPADPGMPPTIAAGARAGAASPGASAGPLPAIVGSGLATGAFPYTVGQDVDILVAGQRVTIRPVEIRDSFPAVDGSRFVVVDRSQLAAVPGQEALPATEVFVQAPPSAATALAAALDRRATGVGLVLDDRESIQAAVRATPVLVWVVLGVAAAAALAATYAVFAATLALALAGSDRTIETAHLRVFGLSRRQAAGLLALEHGPVAVAALLAGALLGSGMFAILLPALGLDAIIGTTADVPLSIDPAAAALLVVAIPAILVVGVGLGAVLERAMAPATAVRKGLE